MPLTKEALKRYMILDKLLSDTYHNYTLDDLTEEVSNSLSEENNASDGVVRRTIEKDLDAIQLDPFYAEIEKYSVVKFNKETLKYRRRMCLRYADHSSSILKQKMTDDEKYLLREALSLIGQFEGLPNLKALESLRLGLGVKDPARKIISLTKSPVEYSSILGELFTAISNRQVIELHYHIFSDPDKVSIVNLIPYLLKEYNLRWYLIAAVENDGTILNFALDRIDKVVPLLSHQYVEYVGNINKRYKEIIGITYYKDNPLQEITYWVSDYSKDYVFTKPLHESQKQLEGEYENVLRKKYPILEKGAFFQIKCRENYELIRELCSFGQDLLVLEPISIKQEISQRIEEMRSCYQSL